MFSELIFLASVALSMTLQPGSVSNLTEAPKPPEIRPYALVDEIENDSVARIEIVVNDEILMVDYSVEVLEKVTCKSLEEKGKIEVKVEEMNNNWFVVAEGNGTAVLCEL